MRQAALTFAPWSQREMRRIWMAGAACLAMAMAAFLGFALYAQNAWRQDLEGRRPTAAFLLAEMGRYLAAAGYRSPVVEREGRLGFLSGVPLFRLGEAHMDPRHRAAIKAMGDSLAFVSACYLEPKDGSVAAVPKGPVTCRPGVERVGSLGITIEGHADAKPIVAGAKGFANNKALSSARAVAMRHTLMSARALEPYGIHWAAIGWGDARPRFKPGENARNRRIELMFVLPDQ